jgi:hypothetical protein
LCGRTSNTPGIAVALVAKSSSFDTFWQSTY